MARVVTRKGDLLLVTLEDGRHRYFQYIANDLTQLNSDVIRVFRRSYAPDARPELADVVKDEVHFYAHTQVNLGIKLGLWAKAGHVNEVGPLDMVFRDTHDYPFIRGKRVEVSHHWFVWRIGESFRDVGELQPANRDAEIGIVFNPYDIVERMRSGKYPGVYPRYE